jgi:hypothetical protein
MMILFSAEIVAPPRAEGLKLFWRAKLARFEL